MNTSVTTAWPFPDGPADMDVFFHKEIVCYYHGPENTWECRRITPQDLSQVGERLRNVS